MYHEGKVNGRNQQESISIGLDRIGFAARLGVSSSSPRFKPLVGGKLLGNCDPKPVENWFYFRAFQAIESSAHIFGLESAKTQSCRLRSLLLCLYHLQRKRGFPSIESIEKNGGGVSPWSNCSW